MQRSACLLRISSDQVHGVWHGASWSGGQSSEAAAAFTASGAPALGDAVDAVLAAILPPRRLTSPFVCISLEGAHVMAAILTFAKLPKVDLDRRLIITQRFCREHRLEPGLVEIVGSPVQSSKAGTGRLLCLAMQRDTLRQIEKALAARGLHADIVAPDCLLKLGQIDRSQLETPGIALFEEKGFRTILVWDEQGALAHLATVTRPARHDLEGQLRMATRIRRYAQIVARQGPVAVYVDGLAAGAIAPDLTYSAGLKLLQWPGEHRSFRRAAAG